MPASKRYWAIVLFLSLFKRLAWHYSQSRPLTLSNPHEPAQISRSYGGVTTVSEKRAASIFMTNRYGVIPPICHPSNRIQCHPVSAVDTPSFNNLRISQSLHYLRKQFCIRCRSMTALGTATIMPPRNSKASVTAWEIKTLVWGKKKAIQFSYQVHEASGRQLCVNKPSRVASVGTQRSCCDFYHSTTGVRRGLDATEVNTSDNRARNFSPSKHFVSVLWGAFAKQLRKLLASWCPSLRTLGFAAVPCGGSFVKFHIWGTYIFRRIPVLVKAGQHWHVLYTTTYAHF